MLAPVLAHVWRGAVSEAAIRGHVAVVEPDGRIIAAVGDAAAVTTLRSSVKPLQALVFVRRALDAVGATDAELALVCGSHNGEAEHVATARSLLARAGVPEAALACGPQLPFDELSARRLLAAGESPQPIHNNCSGKHAGMLAACAVAGWPLQGYIEPDHPCQREVTAVLAGFLDVELGSAPWGIDGCGLPTYGVPIASLARAFAAGAADPGFRRCRHAMAAHPWLVAGSGRFDTAVLAGAGGTVTAKGGGAAVWAATVAGAGVAIKLEAGGAEALPAVALEVLRRLGATGEPMPEGLRPFARPSVTNWAGRTVGEIAVEPGAFAPLGGG